MAKKEKIQKNNNGKEKKREPILHSVTKKWIKAIVIFLIAIITALSFLDRAGIAGQLLVRGLQLLFGDSKITITTIILALFAAAFVFLRSHKKVKALPIVLAILVTITGISGISANQKLNLNQM